MTELSRGPIDCRIFTQDGTPLSLSDLNVRPFSRAALQIAQDLKPINLTNSDFRPLLLQNFSKYGFAVLEPREKTARVVNDTYTYLKDFLHNAPLQDKMSFRQGAALGMDVKYNPPKLRGNLRSPFEEIIAQRDFVLSDEFKDKWPKSALKLRESAIDLIGEFEAIAQEILTTIEKLYHAPQGLFSEIAFDSDLSTLRMIHCVPEREYLAAPNAYGQPTEEYQQQSPNEPIRSCINIHTDWGPLTILPVATTGGLEYWYEDTTSSEGAESGWVDLNAKPGQLLAMLGNVSDIFSRGELRAVPHRVRVSEEQERFSFAYFVEVKSQVDLSEVSDSLKIPNVPIERRSFYELEAREKITGSLTAKEYLNFMINK